MADDGMSVALTAAYGGADEGDSAAGDDAGSQNDDDGASSQADGDNDDDAASGAEADGGADGEGSSAAPSTAGGRGGGAAANSALDRFMESSLDVLSARAAMSYDRRVGADASCQAACLLAAAFGNTRHAWTMAHH